jgi:hypothetical protein
MCDQEYKLPRITVQFEITGNESDELLASMKREEKMWEGLLAKWMGQMVQEQLKDQGIETSLSIDTL